MLHALRPVIVVACPLVKPKYFKVLFAEAKDEPTQPELMIVFKELEERFVQPANILLAFVTLLRKPKLALIVVSDEQPLNILEMLVAYLSLPNSIGTLARLVQFLNMPLKFVQLLVS